jgi:hypothetical protein
MSQGAFNLEPREDIAFVKRLAEHGRALASAADLEEMRERIRYAILECGLEYVIFRSSAAGKTETYAQAFEAHYHEPLEPKRRKGKRVCSR